MSTPAVLPVPVAEEEDITRQSDRRWDYDDDTVRRRPSRKGKEKESEAGEGTPWSANGETSFALDEQQSLNGATRTSSYPPSNDEQEETRRIQEHLKRMEEAELQRRKAARQSQSQAAGGGSSQSSIVENVTRRASLLWQNRLSGHHSNGSGSSRRNGSLGSGLGQHQKLPSTDHVPLTNIPADVDSPNASPTRSETNLSINTVSTITSLPSKRKDVDLNAKRLQEPVDDPFDPPEQHEAEVSSPFSDPPEPSTPGAYQTSALAGESPRGSSDYPGVVITTTRQPPPPKPLGLPRPKTPPPPIDGREDEDEGGTTGVKRTRWWHELLCGCGEGPDRGGDHQAGKTNPFE